MKSERRGGDGQGERPRNTRIWDFVEKGLIDRNEADVEVGVQQSGVSADQKLNQRLVHFFDRAKRSIAVVDDIVVIEVKIRNEIVHCENPNYVSE